MWILNNTEKHLPTLLDDNNCSTNDIVTKNRKLEGRQNVHFPWRMSNSPTMRILSVKNRKMHEKQLFEILRNRHFTNNILRNASNNNRKTIILNDDKRKISLPDSHKVVKNDSFQNNIKSEVYNTSILSKLPFKLMDRSFEDDKKTLEDYKYSHAYENTCRWPTLSANSLDLKDYVNHRRQYRCTYYDKYEKLVTQSSDGSIFIAKPRNSLINGEIECYLQKLSGTLRPNIRKWEFDGNKIKVRIKNIFKIKYIYYFLLLLCYKVNMLVCLQDV